MAVLCQCKKDKGKSVPPCAFYRRSPHKAGEGLLHGEALFICLGPLQTSSCRTRTAVFIWKINIFVEDRFLQLI